jgi:hypothetical protein
MRVQGFATELGLANGYQAERLAWIKCRMDCLRDTLNKRKHRGKTAALDVR